MVLLSMMSIQWYLGLLEWQELQRVDGLSTAISGYWRFYASESILSLEADVFGALILVLFTKWFWEVHSDQSTDHEGSDEEN